MFGLVRSTTSSLQTLFADIFKFTDSIATESKTSTCERLDFIIFGATGCMGRNTVFEAVQIFKNYNWGIAGRNQHKLQLMIEQVEKRASIDLVNVPILIANVHDQTSLNILAESCKVLINCSGPYYKLAEPVMQACLRAGCHYVDMCCEPYVMELMQYKYHEEACLKKIFMVSACGVQSLPYEMAINYLEQNFNGTINSVEIYTEYSSAQSPLLTPVASISTWRCLVQACANIRDITVLRQRMHKPPRQQLQPTAPFRGLIHRSEIVNGVCVQFPLIDKEIVERSQYFNSEQYEKRPIQYNSYLVFPNYFRAILFFIWALVITVMAQRPSFRDILLKYPRIFSLGFISYACPEQTFLKHTSMQLTVNATGWSRVIQRDNVHFLPETNRTMKLSLVGINPVYGIACVCLLSSALTILKDYKRMPGSGGVLTPGAAFSNTTLIKELTKCNRGLVFEITEINQ